MSGALSLRGIWSAMTAADRVASFGLLALSCALALGLRAEARPARAVVLSGRTVVAELPLDQDATLSVRGRIGELIVTVANGAVRVSESSCPQRLCVAMGERRRPGEMLACVPNAVLVRLEGEAKPGEDVPDAVLR
ncbi:MAG: NusG domain II-containing protein [Candidatus Eiseniibacteriota bacterium]